MNVAGEFGRAPDTMIGSRRESERPASPRVRVSPATPPHSGTRAGGRVGDRTSRRYRARVGQPGGEQSQSLMRSRNIAQPRRCSAAGPCRAEARFGGIDRRARPAIMSTRDRPDPSVQVDGLDGAAVSAAAGRGSALRAPGRSAWTVAVQPLQDNESLRRKPAASGRRGRSDRSGHRRNRPRRPA